jgi:hypothetical protein
MIITAVYCPSLTQGFPDFQIKLVANDDGSLDLNAYELSERTGKQIFQRTLPKDRARQLRDALNEILAEDESV